MSDRDENISIAELNLSIRAHKVLAKKKLLYVLDIINYGVDNIMYLPNAGSKTVNEIRQAIQRVLSSVALTINNSSKKLGQNQLPLFEEGKNEGASAKIAGDNKKTVKGLIESDGLQAILSTSIAELNLDTRAFNVLKKKKIKTVKQLVELDLLALKKEKNVGRKTISNIIEAIKRLKCHIQL
jgi:DNA-directed RNA polymerase alpha subunit